MQGPAGQLLPLAALHGLIEPGRPPGEGQHVSHHAVSHRLRERAWGVVHLNAEFFGGVKINRIDPGSPFGDDPKTRRKGFKHAGAEPVVPTDHAVDLPGELEQRLLLEPFTNPRPNHFDVSSPEDGLEALKDGQ